jgi:2-polyprenyl-3-methyl-5-hydroxy-6-metoxy-1,4-benzoquinol methylase
MTETVLRYQSKEDDPYSSHAVILRMAGEGRGKRLLDVGSAQGVLAQRFRDRGFTVTCIESDPALAALARDKCDKMIVADLDDGVPGLDGTFDVIVCGDILEHLKEPSALLAGLNRCLAPDGRVIVSAPNVAHLFVRMNLLCGRFEYMERGILDRTHLRFFTRRSFRRLLDEAGLVVERMAATPVPLLLVWPSHRERAWLRTLHAMSAAAARSWPAMFGYQFVAVARLRRNA